MFCLSGFLWCLPPVLNLLRSRFHCALSTNVAESGLRIFVSL